MERPDPSPDVLGNGDLLEEILLRLHIPALLLASQACKFWRTHAKDPAFLRRFHQRLASRPRPLGFYITLGDDYRTKFVPMSQSQAGLAEVASRASFAHHPNPDGYSRVLDYRNGCLLLNLDEDGFGPSAVLSPLALDETRVMTTLPRWQPSPDGADTDQFAFLPEPGDDHGGDELSFFVVTISRNADAHQGAAVCFSSVRQIEADFLKYDWIFGADEVLFQLAAYRWVQQLPVRGYLCMLCRGGYIVRLELGSMGFLTIELPRGIKVVTAYDKPGVDAQMLSRADDSGVYFIQVRGFTLSVWHFEAIGSLAGTWVREDTIFLPEAFGHLANPEWKPGARHFENYDVFHLYGAGDNAEFVFLVDNFSDDQEIYYLNIRTRKVELVYDGTEEDGDVIGIYPFMIV